LKKLEQLFYLTGTNRLQMVKSESADLLKQQAEQTRAAKEFREKLIKMDNQVERELAILRKRFAESFKLRTLSGGGKVVSFNYEITDPNIRKEYEEVNKQPLSFTLHFELSSGYPDKCIKNFTLGEHKDLTSEVRRFVELNVLKHSKIITDGKPQVRRLFLWLDNNLSILRKMVNQCRDEHKNITEEYKDFPPMINDNILRAARGLPVKRIPVWTHRQAGRYMTEYHEVRKENNFFTICQTPELAVEVTMQPVNAFEVDAAILFSDIMVVCQALGMEVEMVKGKGPVMKCPLRTPEDLDSLTVDVDVKESLKYVFEAITLCRRKLAGKVPLIGFTGGPWTLLGYMVEGGGSKTWSKAKRWMWMYPEAVHKLLGIITRVNVDYIVEQIRAGAQLIEVMDTNVSFLGPTEFREFVLPYLGQTCKSIHAKCRAEGLPEVPLTLFAKGANHSLELQADLGYDVLSLDWCISPEEARKRVGNKVALQGNLDPCALYGDSEEIKRQVRKMVDGFGAIGYIANLGHGMYPDMPRESMETFVNAVHTESENILMKS